MSDKIHEIAINLNDEVNALTADLVRVTAARGDLIARNAALDDSLESALDDLRKSNKEVDRLIAKREAMEKAIHDLLNECAAPSDQDGDSYRAAREAAQAFLKDRT